MRKPMKLAAMHCILIAMWVVIAAGDPAAVRADGENQTDGVASLPTEATGGGVRPGEDASARTAPAAGGIHAGEEISVPEDPAGGGIQATPAVAFGQETYMVAWREGWHGKGGSARVHAARFSTEGKPLDAKAIELAPAGEGVQERPRIAFGGGLFLAVWQDLRKGSRSQILAARISPAGGVLDREPIVVAGHPEGGVLPDVASDGRDFLVVWQGIRGDETGFRGWAAPVSGEGKVGRPVETGMTPQPKVAFSGGKYLAASGGAGFWGGNVVAALLAADGTPEAKPAFIFRGTKEAIFSLSSASEAGWLVVSHRSPPDPWGWGGPGALRAVAVGRDGQPRNKDGIQEPSGVQDRLPGWLDLGKKKEAGSTWPWGESASAFDGKRSVVVWQRYHLGGEMKTNFENCDLAAARVDGFTSLDPAGILVASEPEDERRPSIASNGKGRLLLVYEKCRGQSRGTIRGRVLLTQ